MLDVKQLLICLLRLALVFVAMLIAYLVSAMLISDTGVEMTPAEQAQAGWAMLVVAGVSALLLSFLIVRSPWRGLKLVGAIFTVQFGIETFMTQVETLYFNDAVQMETAMLTSIVTAGALRAAIFAPLATSIFGKLRHTAALNEQKRPGLPPSWVKRAVLLAIFYVVVYFVFGYFVAWQWEETRLYYTGATRDKTILHPPSGSLPPPRFMDHRLPTVTWRALDSACHPDRPYDCRQTLGSLAGRSSELLPVDGTATHFIPQPVYAGRRSTITFRRTDDVHAVIWRGCWLVDVQRGRRHRMIFLSYSLAITNIQIEYPQAFRVIRIAWGVISNFF